MRLRACLAGTVLAALPGAGGASDAPAGARPGGVSCEILGYDIILHNRGDEALAPGTSVRWSVPFARVGGGHVFAAPLAPGAARVLAGAMGSNYLTPDKPCEVALD